MTTFFRYVTFAFTLFLLGASVPEASAQTNKKASRRGPDGIKKGQTGGGNAERQMLLDKQKAVASAKTSGGMTPATSYSMPSNQYDTGKGGFKFTEYKEKKVSKRATKTRKSKRLIDKDNPDGKLYQQSLNKRNRKFLIF
jgi:hypothetical protein